MKNFTPIFTLLLLVSCTKAAPIISPSTTCHSYILLSDKYYSDSVYWKTDKLWSRACASDSDITLIRSVPDSLLWISSCPSHPFIEHMRYIIDGKDLVPFKKLK